MPHPDLYNPWTADDVLRMLLVGLLLGVALRAVRLHRDPTPLMICGYLFAAVVAFTYTWRWSATVATGHSGHFTYGGAYIATAFIFAAAIYAGKAGASRFVHRRRNAATSTRLRQQLQQRRRDRAANEQQATDADKTGQDT